MSLGGSTTSQEEGRPASLKDLKSRYELVGKKLQIDESSREFYLAMWKSAPYATIAAISTLALTFFTPSQPVIHLGDMPLPAFSIGPMAAAILVGAIGLVGWCVQSKLSEEIARSTIESEDIDRQLQRRRAKVEAQFIISRPYVGECDLDKIYFTEHIRGPLHNELDGVVPWILDDMKHMDGDLMMLMSRFREKAVELHGKLASFYDAAKANMELLDKTVGLTSQQPPDLQPNRIHGLYLILGGHVRSYLDVQIVAGASPKVYVSSNQESSFIRDLFGKQDSTNPYPSLLIDPGLGKLAIDCEKSRTDAGAAYTIANQVITVNYGQQEYSPGLSSFGVR